MEKTPDELKDTSAAQKTAGKTAAADRKAEVKSAIALREEEIQARWKERRIFEKTEERPGEEFTFYDGPPFATGEPHYGHLIGGTLKDAFPRYQTMKGKRVLRRWGWDCHGLPLENLIEKELGLKTKKDIEDLGVGKFNAAARASVLRYADVWKQVVPRLGRFVDMENDYKTMDATYTETIWWMFKSLHDKGLIEKGFKAMHLCPRCETTLSNFEVNQGYKDITDFSATAEFELVDTPKTFILAWTTTPWTLPGNAALAINPEIEYVAVTGEEAGNTYILAKARVEKVFGVGKYTIVRTVPAQELIGKSYKPLFSYYENAKLVHKENAWKVYAADFVTTTDGTGIVHIAPAFGADDLALAQKFHIPLIQHVATNGHFKKEVTDFPDMAVKPIDGDKEKDAHQKTDIEVIKWLAHNGKLFAKEKIIHSYPHCWRCETPLLNYATSSWFVKVTSFRDKLVEANKNIGWVPPEIGGNRFGKWLEEARDWAISRSRYWGAPLPAWVCTKCDHLEILGSLDELRAKTQGTNSYFVMRHGEAEQNLIDVVSCDPKDPYMLTSAGKEQALAAASLLKEKHIDLIFSSDFVRTRETAELVREKLGLKPEQVIFDPRLRELNIGAYQGKTWAEFHKHYSFADRFTKKPEGGETHGDVKKRMLEFLFEIDEKYKGKHILVISHDTPLFFLTVGAQGMEEKQVLLAHEREYNYYHPGEMREIQFAPFPHNERFDLDFHRPFIDEVEFSCKKCAADSGAKMIRVPEVFDCWFESGSMPYAQQHYMGKPLPGFDPEKGIGFPADFIAEGLDQTRGWFYSMLVLGVALFGKSPYRNVIVNGLVLAEDGRKMSKSLKNYPDLMVVVNKYGADSLRYYLLSSSAVHAEDLRFSEKGVDEVMKKIVLRLQNVCSFYELYKGEMPEAEAKPEKMEHPLDRWMIARLAEATAAVTAAMDRYEADRACWPIMDLIDDFSTWYIRRSRDRFKGENEADCSDALATTRFALLTTAKLLAPFMPFLAEDIYLRAGGELESVHLEMWPTDKRTAEEIAAQWDILADMKELRMLVTEALEARSKAGVKNRQPLALLTVSTDRKALSEPDFAAILRDEVNVKRASFEGKKGERVVLDTVLTAELREEGEMRELVRGIQDARKKANLDARSKAKLVASVSEAAAKILLKFDAEIKAICNLSAIEIKPEKPGTEPYSFA